MLEQIHRSAVPFFCSETLFSCSEVRSSYSEPLFSCSKVRSSCSEMVFSYSNKMPFWYSKSLALDPARSHSRWALWTFVSISFTASFSFMFSSTRGSIPTFRIQGFLENRTMIYASPNSPKRHGGPLPGLPRNCSPYHPFFAATCYYTPNIR